MEGGGGGSLEERGLQDTRRRALEGSGGGGGVGGMGMPSRGVMRAPPARTNIRGVPAMGGRGGGVDGPNLNGLNANTGGETNVSCLR